MNVSLVKGQRLFFLILSTEVCSIDLGCRTIELYCRIEWSVTITFFAFRVGRIFDFVIGIRYMGRGCSGWGSPCCVWSLERT